ncbi:OTU-like cysteine protease, putative [Trypanosoma equiperdum]|uniref:OTU-like cysteine protease, putative n=1 Tax=Trypanosoma equiperdum TaxID=5694 RepID=A0A1G4HZV3_TRYEQ|nr:OTU-like cysteine protease, putative [Trypanosoma equiperdum]
MSAIKELVERKVKRGPYAHHELIICPGYSNTGNASTNTKGSAAASDTRSNSLPGVGSKGHRCWLCASLVKPIEPQEVLLCFRCLRVAFLDIIMPLVDSPERRKADAKFISKISRVKDTEGTTPLVPKLPTVVSATPPAANEVQSTNHVSQSRSTLPSDPSGRTQLANDSGLGRGVDSHRCSSAWAHRRCIEVGDQGTPAGNGHDELTVKCPVCHATCSATDKRLTRCLDGKTVHLIWVCSMCNTTNTQNSDECHSCKAPFVWPCLQCGLTQESPCCGDELRMCVECEALNTPADILASLKRACLGGEGGYAETDGDLGLDDEGNDGTAGDADLVGSVFGVNDLDTVAEKARQREIVEGRARLQRRMRRLGVEANVQESDGNCLFRSLATQLLGDPGAHMTIRRLVVGYMKVRQESYKILFDGEEEWSNYISNMYCSGSWGDELCLNAACRCFRVNIHVITSAASGWHLVFQCDDLQDSATAPYGDSGQGRLFETAGSICLFLNYIAPVHYDDVPVFRSQVISLNAKLTEQLQYMLAEEGRSRSRRDDARRSGAVRVGQLQSCPSIGGEGQPLQKLEEQGQRCAKQQLESDENSACCVDGKVQQRMDAKLPLQLSGEQRQKTDEKYLTDTCRDRPRLMNEGSPRPATGHPHRACNDHTVRQMNTHKQWRTSEEMSRDVDEGRLWLANSETLSQGTGDRQRGMGEHPKRLMNEEIMRQVNGQQQQQWVNEGHRRPLDEKYLTDTCRDRPRLMNEGSPRPATGHPHRACNDHTVRQMNTHKQWRTSEEMSRDVDEGRLWRMNPLSLHRGGEVQQPDHSRDHQPRAHGLPQRAGRLHDPHTPREQSVSGQQHRQWVLPPPAPGCNNEFTLPIPSRPNTMRQFRESRPSTLSSDSAVASTGLFPRPNGQNWPLGDLRGPH